MNWFEPDTDNLLDDFSLKERNEMKDLNVKIEFLYVKLDPQKKRLSRKSPITRWKKW
jgi:hypothetical protein